MLIGCQIKLPKADRELYPYVGVINRGVYNSNLKKLIKIEDPVFGDMICLRQSDFRCAYKTWVINCAQWKEQTVRCDND